MTTTSTFEIIFTKYSGVTCERRISAPVRIQAVDFANAYNRALDRLQGMKDICNMDRMELAIVSIAAVGYHGTVCDNILDIWEVRPTQ